MKLNYVVIGTNDMAKAIHFYEKLFEQTGIEQILSTDRMTYWQGNDFAFALALPFDQNPATHGNGSMIGFSVDSHDEVTRLYTKALELGGTCEGTPNQRGPYFSAYVRDLDKNKLCFGA